MNLRIDDLDKIYSLCLKTGNVKEKQPDIELIKSMYLISSQGLDFIKETSKTLSKKSSFWTFVFRDYYESLRGLIESYLLFKGISADSHQCKNAYLCFKFSELDLDWNFLETIRLKRNSINYRGYSLSYDDWKYFELNFQLHLSILDKEVKKIIS